MAASDPWRELGVELPAAQSPRREELEKRTYLKRMPILREVMRRWGFKGESSHRTGSLVNLCGGKLPQLWAASTCPFPGIWVEFLRVLHRFAGGERPKSWSRWRQGTRFRGKSVPRVGDQQVSVC